MILVLLGSLGLAYALYVQNKSLYPTAPSPPSSTTETRIFRPILGDTQFITMKDRIFSSDITENHIERKESNLNNGLFGLTETQLRLNPGDPTMVIYGPKVKLNI
jgi:hypothetical protein